MRIFEEAVLHPNLDNEHRYAVHDWCEENIGQRYHDWSDSSNYDEHGTFNIIIHGIDNEPAVMMFLLKYPNTQLIETKYQYKTTIAKEALQLFEGLESFLKNGPVSTAMLDKETIDKNILDFKENIKNLNVVDIAKNTSVKFQSQDKTKVYDNNKRIPFKFVSGTPAQAKAALAYNDLLVKWNLVKSVPKILHGQKIKWVYMKQNEYGIEGLAMKADGTDPDQIMDFIIKYIDREAMYEQELKSKLIDFYKVLNWDYPSENDAKASEFFGF